MLAKILEEMWVEPAVLEALSEEQKRILFLKMREEQVRRWREREEGEGRGVCSRPQKAARKHVTWLLGRDGDISVSVIGELDEFRSALLLQSRTNNRCHSVKGTFSTSTDSRHDSRSSEEEDVKDTSEDSDSESGNSSDNLGDWPPLHGLRLSNHGNTAPLKAPLSEAELVSSEDRGPARLQRRNGGRVAQLRRAFTADPHPSSTEAPGPVRPARSHGRSAALTH